MLPEKDDVYFSSDNLDMYLKELAKEFRKLNGKTVPAEVTLVGGAAILANYGFRDRTYDIDVLVHASAAMKEAATHVGDKYNLPTGWFNSDFKNTKSYSPKLEQYSKHYKTFSNIVEFRTVSAEYLIAMKLMAGRPYKHDLSDVAEILAEHQKRGEPIEYNSIMVAFINLYDDLNKMPESSEAFLTEVYETKNISEIIAKRKEYEQSSKTTLIDFQNNYEGVLNENNLSDILSTLNKKKNGTKIGHGEDE